MQNLRTVYMALVGSLMLNAFFVGYLSAHAAGPHLQQRFHHEGMRGPHLHDFLQQGLDVLDEVQRVKIEEILRADKSQEDAHFRQMHALFAQLRPTLTAPRLDLDKLGALEKKITAEDQKLKQGMSGLVRKVATTLPDKDRIKFFNAAMQEPPTDDPPHEATGPHMDMPPPDMLPAVGDADAPDKEMPSNKISDEPPTE